MIKEVYNLPYNIEHSSKWHDQKEVYNLTNIIRTLNVLVIDKKEVYNLLI